MSIPGAILDTNILSVVIAGRPEVAQRAREYLLVHQGLFTFSIITRYEVLKGLKARGATAQVERFEQFCKRNVVLPLSDDVIVRAADIYADLRRRGEMIEDADILIAATALAAGLDVITNNERHFRRIAELTVENWLR